jgi:Kef-type K+ transport system membrane component KefB
MDDPYAILLIICGLAFVIPFLAARIKYIELPIIVLEIIFGILIGKSGLGLIEIDPTKDLFQQEEAVHQLILFLSSFGFAFLMFLSGIEIDFTYIKPKKLVFKKKRFLKSLMNDPLKLGIIVFIVTFALGYIISVFLVLLNLIGDATIMALILATSSVGVIVPTIHQMGLNKTEYGQNILLSALVADLSTMLMVTIYIAIKVQGGVTPSILIIGALFVAFFGVYKFGQIMTKRTKISTNLLSKVSKTAEIRVRGAFVLMLLFIVLAEMIGTEIILGAFLAGAIVSLLVTREESAALHMKLYGIGYGFFVPIFFIMVGVQFDIQALLASPGTLALVPVLMIAAFLVKIIASYAFVHRYGKSKSVAAGILLSSRLSLIIAVSAIGLRLGLIPSAVNSAVILVAVITCIISPAVFMQMIKSRGFGTESGKDPEADEIDKESLKQFKDNVGF